MRLEYKTVDPDAYRAMARLSLYVRESGLEKNLVELLRVRVSQMNGCAFCVDMHTQDARGLGESEQRLYCLSVWKESPFYSERERLALEFSESLVDISGKGVPDELYERVRKVFGEKEYISLVMVVNEISGWNRLSVSCGATAGMYKGIH